MDRLTKVVHGEETYTHGDRIHNVPIQGFGFTHTVTMNAITSCMYTHA